MSAHKVFCEYMCGIPSDRMPPHFLKVTICHPTRSYVCICVKMCGIPSDRMPPHLESIHMSAHKVFCEYMCGIPSDRMPPHFLKESKVCQPTRSFVSICVGFLQIECHLIF